MLPAAPAPLFYGHGRHSPWRHHLDLKRTAELEVLLPAASSGLAGRALRALTRLQATHGKAYVRAHRKVRPSRPGRPRSRPARCPDRHRKGARILSPALSGVAASRNERPDVWPKHSTQPWWALGAAPAAPSPTESTGPLLAALGRRRCSSRRLLPQPPLSEADKVVGVTTRPGSDRIAVVVHPRRRLIADSSRVRARDDRAGHVADEAEPPR
jgi:hypothetical protein